MENSGSSIEHGKQPQVFSVIGQRSYEGTSIHESIQLSQMTRPSVRQHQAVSDGFPTQNNVETNQPEESKDEFDPTVMTFNNPPKNKYRYLSACVWELMVGMTDGVVGGVLPSIEKYYNVNYAIVSLIWMGSALGFITMAFVGHHFDNYFGKQNLPLVSTAVYIVAFAILASGVKVFALIVIAYYLCGVGAALGLAQHNIFITKLKNSSKFLGLFHGVYGLGALAAPLIGTIMTSNLGYQTWHYFFFVPLGLSVINMVSFGYSFRGADTDLEQWYRPDDSEGNVSGKLQANDFIAALKNSRTWLASAFIFFYQGAEVSLGGWVVTFLLDYRGGNRNATGYVASGFWGGVTVGRLGLTHILAKNLGIRRSIMILAILLVGLDLLVWLVPNTIAAGTFVSVMGVLIGPMYPLMISIVADMLPRKVRFCGLLIATAFGSSGGSIIPFLIGLASETVGTFVLHPVVLASYVLMFLSWVLMPNIERKGAIKTIWQRVW